MVPRWAGTVCNITRKKSTIVIEAADMLADFSKIDVPVGVDCKLLLAADAVQTDFLSVSSLTGLEASGTVRIDDEIISYQSVNATALQLLGLTRGLFETVAETHDENTTVDLVTVLGPKNPWDILREDLIQGVGGVPSANVDLSAFSYWRDWPGGDIPFSTVIVEPVKLDRLVTEIADLLDAKIWQDENQRITIRRNIPNQPGRAYHSISDENNIVHDSGSVDLNEQSRITRMLVYWEKSILGDADDVTEYGRLDIGVDADAEGTNGYDGKVEKKILCRWISTRYLQDELVEQYVKNLAMRQVSQNRDARPLLSFEMDIKDNAVKTGDYTKISTDEILLPDGNPIPEHTYQLVKKDRRKNKVVVTCMRVTDRRIAFIAPAGAPEYASATEAQKEYGYICKDDGKMADGSAAYYIW
jgi:hypothetical protein